MAGRGKSAPAVVVMCALKTLTSVRIKYIKFVKKCLNFLRVEGVDFFSFGRIFFCLKYLEGVRLRVSPNLRNFLKFPVCLFWLIYG